MDKKEIINSLERVKLVIGNGFDLFCNIKSSYSDFFEAHRADVESFRNFINYFSGKSFNTAKNYLFPRYDYDKYPVIINPFFKKDLPLWEFILVNRSNVDDKGILWCDIEEIMKNILTSSKKKAYFIDEPINDKLLLEEVAEILTISNLNCNSYANHPESKVIEGFSYEGIITACYLKYMGKANYINSYEDMIAYAFDDLKRFEAIFGEYIYNETNNSYYEVCCNYALNTLLNEKNLVAIDSFNYSVIRYKEDKLRFINGNYKAPIFGIDSNIDVNSLVYRFTKISRRLELDISSKDYFDSIPYESIIIFGHSLNEADYNYFIPLFKRLNLGTSKFSGKIVFAYYIYDKAKEAEIRNQLIKNVSKLFIKLEENIDFGREHRLLELINEDRSIMFYEIDKADMPRLADK